MWAHTKRRNRSNRSQSGQCQIGPIRNARHWCNQNDFFYAFRHVFTIGKTNVDHIAPIRTITRPYRYGTLLWGSGSISEVAVLVFATSSSAAVATFVVERKMTSSTLGLSITSKSFERFTDVCCHETQCVVCGLGHVLRFDPSIRLKQTREFFPRLDNVRYMLS